MGPMRQLVHHPVRIFLALAFLSSAPWGLAGAQSTKPGAPPAASGSSTPKFENAAGFEGFETFSIMTLQNTETFSPLTGRVVATSGVVTLLMPGGAGFWIQDPSGDGDPATSDGVYVSMRGASEDIERPAVGDRIRVIAKVEEEQYGLALPRTRLIQPVFLEIEAHGQALPEPVPLVDLPDTELADAIAFWEPLEGMRVRLENARVVSPTNRFGKLNVLTAADAVPGSGYFPQSHALIVHSLGGGRVDYNPERIEIASGTLPQPIQARPGDEIVSLVGVVDYNFGNYNVKPESYELKAQDPPATPVSTRSAPPGNAKIVTYNLRDLFDAVDNPERFDENYDPGSGKLGTPSEEEVDLRLEKHALALVQELALPDIVVAVEFETTELFQRIGDRVNARAGTRYRAVSLETSDRRGLEVGFLYDQKRVELLDHYQLSGPQVEGAFGLTSAFRTREPLVGVFRFQPSGSTVTLIANRFKSKRIEPPLLNLNRRPIRVTEAQRNRQARVVRDFVSSLLEKDPQAMVMAAGDLGDFPFAEPGETEYAVGILEGSAGEVRLKNLLDLETPGEAYTWLYNGNGQAFSHLLVSPALLERCVAADVLHFNSPYPWRLSQDATTALRASDRDPLEARFDF